MVHWYIAIFTVSYFLSEILVIPNNERRRNLENLNFLIFKKLAEMPPAESLFKRFSVSQRSIFRQQTKLQFLEPLKHFFSEYILKIINIVRSSSETVFQQEIQ